MIRQAAACIRAAAEEAGVEMADVACLGIGTPGIYDPETDSLRFAPFAETWGKGILQRLKSEFQTDIVIENSVNLGAIGGALEGGRQTASTTSCMWIWASASGLPSSLTAR